jgi:hypothetical protein
VGRKGACSGKVPAYVQQVVRGEDGNAVHQSRLGGIAGGNHQRPSGLAGGQGNGEYAGDGANLSGEGEFTGELVSGASLARYLTGCRQDAESDGKIESPTLFWKVGRGQIDCDATGREFEA